MLIFFNVFLFLFTLPHLIVSTRCYFCTSMLSSDIDDSAKEAMKNLVYTNFNPPPTHELCALSDDIEFRIVQQIDCGDDRCVLVKAFEKNLHFVMRGCEKSLSRVAPLEPSCTTGSPSVCVCESDLCNHSPISNSPANIALILLFIAFMW
ncbi:unnamed protein product, partial [Mesorhabditis belari]